MALGASLQRVGTLEHRASKANGWTNQFSRKVKAMTGHALSPRDFRKRKCVENTETSMSGRKRQRLATMGAHSVGCEVRDYGTLKEKQVPLHAETYTALVDAALT